VPCNLLPLSISPSATYKETYHLSGTQVAPAVRRASVFVVFKLSPIRPMIQMWTGSLRAGPGEEPMHDLLIALAFIGMVVAPAIVAAKSGAEAADELDD